MALAGAPLPAQTRAYPLEVGRAGARATVTSSGHCGILVPLSIGERFQPPLLLRRDNGNVLEAEVETYTEGTHRLRALMVWCRDPALADAFLAFCEALIERWVAGAPVGESLEVCHDEFRRLVAGPSRLDTSGLVGLLGELIVLADLVEISAPCAVAWGGSEKERHDFRYGCVALEVKTTLRSNIASRKVRVSSIDQLQPPSGGRLFLHAVHLERAEGGPIALGPLVGRIEQRLAGAALEHFRAVLGTQADPGARGQTFSVLSRRSYAVREGFPCLVVSRMSSGRLDEGVSNVQYDLDLSTADEFLVSDHDALTALLAEVK